jgi:5-hydroxyisourate hydrolase-like protein (transthyretin family)
MISISNLYSKLLNFGLGHYQDIFDLGPYSSKSVIKEHSTLFYYELRLDFEIFKLKQMREHFPLFVPMGSALQALAVLERSMSVFDRL